MPFQRIFASLLLLSLGSFAQFHPSNLRKPEPPVGTVREYVRQDYEGARLSADSWAAHIKDLTTWKTDPDWQNIKIISRYEVVSVKEGLRSATIGVRYEVLGQFESGVGYLAEPGSEDADFRLKEIDNAWKIEDLDPLTGPHVSRARVVQWLQASLVKEKDPARRVAIESALKQLQPVNQPAKN
jgi:hypothetical protein